ncbi:MAG TPA: MarR family transcriptional regulator [Allosphingosinicella sp.]|jgi:DNA-binding MarR family transcriptional regulator/CheY-like chemotaxis protein
MAEGALGAVGFGGEPPVLIVADSPKGLERGARSAELAGCRVAGKASFEEAPERLRRQAAVDAVFLDVERDHGAPLDDLLAALRQAGEAGLHGSVVSAPLALMDTIAGCAWHRRIELIADADRVDGAAAIGLAVSRPRHRLHDVGGEQGPPRLQQISEEVRRIASALERISADGTKEESVAPRDAGEAVDAGAVRAIIRARRLRDQYFGPDLFADPAWDILLDLYAAHLEQQRVAVSSLCIAAAVPATTALRWIKTLTDVGLLVRAADPQDGRRVYIELAPQAAEGLRSYLGAAQRISPLNL